MSIWTRLFVGKAIRPFMKPIPGDVAHRKLRPLVYAYVALAFIVFNISMYISGKAKEGTVPQKETTGEYIHRVFKVQNPTVYKISWEKGVEKEELDTTKIYTAPDDEDEEEDEILNGKY